MTNSTTIGDSPAAPPSSEIDTIPDTPLSFGYKMAWFSIPTEDTQKILQTFEFSDVTPANWASGVQAVYMDSKRAFVTPPVDGWTFVLGTGFPIFGTGEQTREFLAYIDALTEHFPTLYYFGTHRVVDFHAWLKVTGQKLDRAYAYLGESSETLCDKGVKTQDEENLGFRFFDELSPESDEEGYFERKDLRYPDEEDVMKISSAWTIDTQTLDTRTEKGVGVLVKIN